MKTDVSAIFFVTAVNCFTESHKPKSWKFGNAKSTRLVLAFWLA